MKPCSQRRDDAELLRKLVSKNTMLSRDVETVSRASSDIGADSLVASITIERLSASLLHKGEPTCARDFLVSINAENTNSRDSWDRAEDSIKALALTLRVKRV